MRMMLEQILVEQASSVLMSKLTFAYRSSDPELVDRYSPYLKVSPLSGTTKVSSGAQSGLLVFKDHDAKAPVRQFFPGSLSPSLIPSKKREQIITFLNRERFPTVVELTGTTFSDVIYNDAKAMVVLAALSDVHHGGNVIGTGSGSQEREYELKQLVQIAKNWRAAPRPKVKDTLLFAWIDADRWAKAVKTCESCLLLLCDESASLLN